MRSELALVDTGGPRGLGEPAGNGTPSVWIKAKLTYSLLVIAAQAALLFLPVLS
jgi:hypothetical protein